MKNEEFDKQSSYYDRGYGTGDFTDIGMPDLKVVDYKADAKGLRILNVGGGASADIWFLAKDNEVHSIDGSAEGVRRAQEHGIKAVVGDVAESLPYEDGYFDIVILKDILEHIYSPMELLAEAKRVLKQDGHMVISLPNHFYLPFRLRMLFGGNLIWKSLLHDHGKDFEEWDYQHIRFFTYKGTQKMLSEAGLEQAKGYWDFGTLAHYSDPMMYEHAFRASGKTVKSRRQFLFYRILLPAFKVFNFVFPKKVRSAIVSLSPNLMCAGFYLRAKKKK